MEENRNQTDGEIEITNLDKKKYLLPEKRDLVILRKVKLLEKKKLKKKDQEILRLIKTQLEKNWRKPLIIYLNRLMEKYK